MLSLNILVQVSYATMALKFQIMPQSEARVGLASRYNGQASSSAARIYLGLGITTASYYNDCHYCCCLLHLFPAAFVPTLSKKSFTTQKSNLRKAGSSLFRHIYKIHYITRSNL